MDYYSTADGILEVYQFGLRGCFPIQGTHLFEWASNSANEEPPPDDMRCKCGEYTYADFKDSPLAEKVEL